MSGDLQLNKIFGAGLAAALVIVGVRVGVDALYHTDAPEKPGYFVDVPEEAAGGGATAEVELLPDWGTVLPTADQAAGQKAFAKCVSCHNVAQGGADMTGPGLWGIVGRPLAAHAGFAYSDAMVAHKAEAPNWTYDELYGFLSSPSKHIKGTKMAFAGIKNKDEKINLIAYLHAQGSAGYAIPAPDASRQPGAVPAADAPAEGAADVAPVSTPPSNPETTPAGDPAPAQ
ncbi:MAG: cytochrome c family protein [Asticcacaulis sp.]